MNKHQIWRDIAAMSDDELEAEYDIVIDADGTVYDNLEGREFEDIDSWADFIIAQESESNYGGVAKFNGKYAFDDEY